MSAIDNEDRTVITRSKVEGVRADQKTAVLELVKGPGSPRRYALALPMLVVGRDPTVDISVASQELSRKHMRITRMGEDYMCVDNDSVNGVYVNGVKIHSAVLHDGDQLQLADVVFLFHGKG